MMLTTTPTRLDYSVKLVCANNFTGPACSIAKICLGRFKGFQFYSRFFVTESDKSAPACLAQKMAKSFVSPDGR